jgi:hypothetical protein
MSYARIVAAPCRFASHNLGLVPFDRKIAHPVPMKKIDIATIGAARRG